MPTTPNVKSARFENRIKCDAGLLNRIFQNRKNRRPHLLPCSCRMEIHRDGLFEIVERNMTTIRERRHRDTLAQLNRATEHRDAAITKLVKLEVRIKTLRRQVQRYEKLAIQPKAEPPKVEVKPLPPAASVTADDGIPDFLQRKKETDRRGDEAKKAIIGEQTERKRLKSRGRIEKKKAQQRGDTKRMPLTGKAALEAIRQG